MSSPTAKPYTRAIDQYKIELTGELYSILDYWEQVTIDKDLGGFYGSVDNDNIPDTSAPKGLVLNCRILWAFSSAYRITGKPSHLSTATRAYEYLVSHFIDPVYGGVYWSVDSQGKMLEARKQVYGLAFCIYGLSEYYKVSSEEDALSHAKDLFACIEKYSHDHENGGYIEALTREWKPLEDLRLSEKDDNERKSMNTHLHVIEAYANLYQVWPSEELKNKILCLLDIFNRYIIDSGSKHLHLFMDDNWNVKSSLQSYGHDIEAAWLLYECALVTGHHLYIDHFRGLSVGIVESASEGLDSDGGLWYESDPIAGSMIREKHSWPQAEAMIGFFNAWQISGESKYLDQSLDSWEFVKKHIRDEKKGEWYWGVYGDYSIMQKDKAGFWKCPYHNSRACIEIIRRIETEKS